MGCRNRNSCKNLFKRINVLPLKSQHISFLLIFTVNNKNYFTFDADNYNMLTRQCNNLHLPQENLAIFQKGACYLGTSTVNSLPTEIRTFQIVPRNLKLH